MSHSDGIMEDVETHVCAEKTLQSTVKELNMSNEEILSNLEPL